MNARVSEAMRLASNMTSKRKRNKFNAIRTVIGGVMFHSKGEAIRWTELKNLESAGEIIGLRRQVPFKLYAWSPDGEKVQIGTYKADFQYRDARTNEEITEDFKGMRTTHFSRTAKIMKANYGITIKETK